MYQIIIDSCGELPEKLHHDRHFCHVPLELEVDGQILRDDAGLSQNRLLALIKRSVTAPKSACPSPELFYQAIRKDAERVYIVTLSSKLSGSYNSAYLGRNLYTDEHPGEKQIYVFNSRSASIGETIIALKIQELEEKGEPFEQVVEQVEQYIASVNTFFVLETLDTLRKAGRLGQFRAILANTLNIKPIMGSTKEGSIQQLAQARGMKKALGQMTECLMNVTRDCENRILAISHCNCLERAIFVKEKLERLAHFKKIIIVDTAGISTMYANDGGVIVAV